MDNKTKVHIAPYQGDVDSDKVKQSYLSTSPDKFQLPRASGRQLAFLSQLITDVGVIRYSKVKTELGLAGILATDLSRADCQRLIAELRRLRGRRR